MSGLTEPLPGTSDLWEPEVAEWRDLEGIARNVFNRYGYTELRTPIMERTEVFVRNLGNETDVVQKEMYTFQDRGGRSLSLRPEGTAGVMRAIANHGLNTGEECRVFYMGPMFRGERPAAGRRRQFHQVGCEAVGCNSPWMDAETIAMLVHFLAELGITGAKVMVNSRGLPEDRPPIAAALKEYFRPHLAEMCPDCQRRFEGNVWRMLDCKVPACHEIALGAPHIADLLGEASKDFFAKVCDGLKSLGVDFEVAPRLVRGLDYYVHTVFEITHTALGAQDALAGGGRYQITLPGTNTAIEGVGFAAGIERLLMARNALGIKAEEQPAADTYIIGPSAPAIPVALQLAGELRSKSLGGRVHADFTGRSMKGQFRSANKSGAKRVLVIGDDELANGTVTCKNMADGSQTSVPRAEVAAWLEKISN
ncbi:MAG: histidine--tRNA ligase [Victivallales bacterium]|nr:histidine--tRNA ligase [Victivallales bacterium]